MDKHIDEIVTKGFTIIPAFFDNECMQKAAQAIDESYELCRSIQIKNIIDAVTDGTVHHLLTSENPIYIELLQRICNSPKYAFIKKYFGGNCIVNSYGGVINLKSKPSYVANIHRDIRFFSGDFPLMLNMLIMIDDFTLENGATYLLAKSHVSDSKPTVEDFYKNSDRAVGKKGDILFFNSNLWHAAGINTTDVERRAITITFTKPFMKQQLDYSRAIGYDEVVKLPEEIQQLLGYFSRIPSNINEWYQTPENRFYRPGQD